MNDHNRVITDCDDAIRLDPSLAAAYCCRGIAWAAKRAFDKAIADYDQAIGLDPNLSAAYCCRGNAWFSKHNYAAAITDYDEAIRLDPTEGSAYCNQAWILATCPEFKYRNGKRAVEVATRLPLGRVDQKPRTCNSRCGLCRSR